MRQRTYDNLKSIRVRPTLHSRMKEQAAREGLSVIDLADQIVGEALADRKKQTSRLGANAKPTRTRPVD
jgi:hypothetical protein